MATQRTVVWDLGGVVLRWEPIELVRAALADRLASLGVDAASLTSMLFGDFTPDGFWQAFDRGLIGRDEVACEMARSGLSVGEVARVLDAIPSHLALRLDTVALIDQVRAAGHRVVYLSNMPAPYADGLEHLLEPIFAGGVFSGRVGHIKPAAEIFDLAARQLDLDPGRTFFVDDRRRNVTAVRALGWDAAVFTDAASCSADLALAGWL